MYKREMMGEIGKERESSVDMVNLTSVLTKV